jgi:hypothetical protein
MPVLSYVANPGVIPIAIPFSYYPTGVPIAYVIGLYSDSACTQLVKASVRSANVVSAGLTTPKTRCTTTIDLTATPFGDYFQGYTAYVNNVARPVFPLPAGESVTVQGLTTDSPIWG